KARRTQSRAPGADLTSPKYYSRATTPRSIAGDAIRRSYARRQLDLSLSTPSSSIPPTSKYWDWTNDRDHTSTPKARARAPDISQQPRTRRHHFVHRTHCDGHFLPLHDPTARLDAHPTSGLHPHRRWLH